MVVVVTHTLPIIHIPVSYPNICFSDVGLVICKTESTKKNIAKKYNNNSLIILEFFTMFSSKEQ